MFFSFLRVCGIGRALSIACLAGVVYSFLFFCCRQSDEVNPAASPGPIGQQALALPAIPGDLAGEALAPAAPLDLPDIAPQPLPAREQLSEAEVRGVLLAAGWREPELSQAVAVAWCESRWRPGAIGDSGRSLGLMQLWVGWFDWAGVPLALWSDPQQNAEVAHLVWARDLGRGGDGWRNWSCQP